MVFWKFSRNQILRENAARPFFISGFCGGACNADEIPLHSGTLLEETPQHVR